MPYNPWAFAMKSVGADNMSLRDYFAAKAMQALIAREFGKGENDRHLHVATAAFAYADAMLEAREKRP